MITTILGYILVGLFFVIDARGRMGQAAKSLETGPSDHGTTGLIGRAFFLSGLCLLAAPVLSYFQTGTLTWVVGWFGVIVGLLGLAFRLWGFRTLGQFYTRTLRTSENQPSVREGPYQYIRHPGYLGTMLIFIGAALASTNWITLGIVTIAMFTAYHYRIHAEENMLVVAKGKEFSDYRAHTWKLIPFLY